MKYILPTLLASSALALVGCDSSSSSSPDNENIENGNENENSEVEENTPTELSISSENATLLATVVMDTLERRMEDGFDSSPTDFANRVESYDKVIGGTGTTGSENCDSSGNFSTQRSAAIDYTVSGTNLPGELAGKSITLNYNACVERGIFGDNEYTGTISATYADDHTLSDNKIDIETDQHTVHAGQGNNDDTEREYSYSGKMNFRDEYNSGTQIGKTQYTFTDMNMTVAYKGDTSDLKKYTVTFRDITLAVLRDNNTPAVEDRSIDGTIVIDGLTAQIDTKADGAFDARGDDETQLHVTITGRDDTTMVIKGVDASQVSIAINGGSAKTVQRETLVLSDPSAAGGALLATSK